MENLVDWKNSSNFAPAKMRWSHRLSARTRDFHSLKRGSIPLGTTEFKSVICTASATEYFGNGGGGYLKRHPPRAVFKTQDP